MFGNVLKELRLNRNMSQVELARTLQVSKQSVSNWENENIFPSIDMLVRIAGLFSVSTDCLLGLDTRQYLEVTGLSDMELTHLRQVIDDLRRRG